MGYKLRLLSNGGFIKISIIPVVATIITLTWYCVASSISTEVTRIYRNLVTDRFTENSSRDPHWMEHDRLTATSTVGVWHSNRSEYPSAIRQVEHWTHCTTVLLERVLRHASPPRQQMAALINSPQPAATQPVRCSCCLLPLYCRLLCPYTFTNCYNLARIV